MIWDLNFVNWINEWIMNVPALTARPHWCESELWIVVVVVVVVVKVEYVVSSSIYTVV